MRVIAENLGGERGGQPVFSSVEFALGKGQSLVATGPNGAGKSTLLRVVAGLLPTAQGSVRLEGGDSDFATIAAASHYLGPLNAMKTSLTVEENLRFWQAFCGSPLLSASDALERVGLGSIGHLPFGFLSTGQRRRAASARLLVTFRPVWLLDEPTTGLDARSAEQFCDLMRAHLEDGGIVVAATHLPLGLVGAQTLEMGEAQNA